MDRGPEAGPNERRRCRTEPPQVRVTAVDPAVPEALCEFYGVGKLDTFTPRTAPHLTLYVWQVRGKAAAEILERTVLYMVSDIRRDVEYILERTRPAQSYEGDVLVLFDRLESKHASSLSLGNRRINLRIFQDANCT